MQLHTFTSIFHAWMVFYQVQSRSKRVSSSASLFLAVALPLLQDVRVDPRRGDRLREADAGLPLRPACPAALVPEAAASLGGEAGPRRPHEEVGVGAVRPHDVLFRG